MTINVALWDAVEDMLANRGQSPAAESFKAKAQKVIAGDNRNFAEHNSDFRKACERASVKPTRRQASKYRRKFGSAYAHRGQS